MLAIVTSHPIQYQAPLWRALAADARVNFEVWFLTPHAVKPSSDREFGRTFAWDVDLLSGYPHRFLEVEEDWRLDRFDGIKLKHSWSEELRARGVTALWIEGWRFRALWSAAQSAHAHGIPLWLRGESHDLGPTSRGLLGWAKRITLRWLFRRTHRFLYIGTANRRFYRQHGVAESNLHPAPYGVDHARFARAAGELRPQRSALRQRWGIPEDAAVVLFCGKLIAKKRPLDLVAAARRLPSLPGRPWHLLFAGDGEFAPLLREQLSVPGTPPGTITGFLNQSEIPAAFIAADCLVLPSDHRETWGLVVNESLACGVPPIVSDRCGCAEDLAAPLGAKHVFPCGDLPALAGRLEAVVTNPPSRESLTRLSVAHAPERTVETVAGLVGRRL